MANFFTDNDDIQFLLKSMDLATLADLMEGNYDAVKSCDYAPKDADEAIENYFLVLDSLGSLCGDFVAPRSEAMDRQGNRLTSKGEVLRPDGMYEIIEKLAKAEVMGMTLPHKYGGLNFPGLMLAVANEMISRGDAALMNIFGLQGIGETLNAFASEEIKDEYLFDLAKGKKTGAMVLTEPEAGSDLQSVKVKAFQDAQGNWYLNGVKRFITNGCGEVHLVLAKSETDRSGGLGLSLFVCDSGPSLKIRRIEDKLGIHASPTCEVFYDNTPCKIVGERQRGLVTYVMALMNGARIGIASQSVGIAEGAYRVARDYASTREQFGAPIDQIPAVRDMLIDMKIAIEECRALLYETCRVVDHEVGNEKILNNPEASKELKKETKKKQRMIKRYAAMLTPMSKYFSSEMSNRVTYDSIQVLGGSGFMRDYPAERLYRDARVTSIYEGTSQLQVVAAVRGVSNGTAEKYIEELASRDFAPELKGLLDILAKDAQVLSETAAFVKDQGVKYMDLHGAKLVDMAAKIIVGYLFASQASSKYDMQVDSANGEKVSMKQRKAIIAKRYIEHNSPNIVAWSKNIMSGSTSSLDNFDELAGATQTEI